VRAAAIATGSLLPFGPQSDNGRGGRMFTYRLYLEDGTDAGTAAYADNVNPGESIWLGPGREYRVLDVVPPARRRIRRSLGCSG
jgi:hypothetical protein